MRSHDRLMVVPYKETRFRKIWIVILLVVIATGFYQVGFFVGGKSLVRENKSLLQQKKELTQRVFDQDNIISGIRQKLVNDERGIAIDRQAQEDVKKVILKQKGQIRKLIKERAFYKNIMAPNAKDAGLKIDKLVISKGIEANHYHYQLILTKSGNNRKPIKGSVYVSVLGLSKSAERELWIQGNIRQKASVIKQRKIRLKLFKFRYFQALEGRFILPKEFRPVKVKVIVQAKSIRKSQPVKQLFDWTLEKG